jgi:flagellar motor protein MotB
MAKSACKCKKAAECEECPEWIFTFADLVMLMMGFFVILFVLKPTGNPGASPADAQSQSEQHWRDVVGEIRKGFGYEPDPHSSDPVDQAMIERARGKKDGAENDHPRETTPGTDHDVTSIRPGSHTVVGTRLMFDRGQSILTPQTIKGLDDISGRIRGHNTIVLIKGHTALDDLPDSTAQQRMDLSLRRAQTAADYMMSKGVSAEVIRVQGCSTFEPVRQREYSAAGLADNRRVEIEWTAELVEERQDQNNTPAKPLDESSSPTTKPTTVETSKLAGAK